MIEPSVTVDSEIEDVFFDDEGYPYVSYVGQPNAVGLPWPPAMLYQDCVAARSSGEQITMQDIEEAFAADGPGVLL